MIEQIPLALVIDDAVVVGPAAIVVLSHNQTFILVRSHRILTHGIAQNLRVLSDVRIGKIVVAVILESQRALGLTVGQIFKAVDAIHLKFAFAPLHFLLGRVVGQFLHVGLEFGTATCSPEDIGIAV